MLPIHFAPLQGHTDDAFRRIHHQLVGGVASYYTPFIRLENGKLRSKEIRDIKPEWNAGVPVIPQVMAGDSKEFRMLADHIAELGNYEHIDIDMGCPFPLQTRHGKGSGILSHPDKVADVLGAIPQLIDEGKAKHFSLKMRLGQEQPDEWGQLIDIINKAPLEYVTIHPRIGTQQYKGEIFMDEFEKFASECSHPIIYNGDIRTPEDITTIEQRFPNLAGVMIGRGLLARPSLAVEYATGEEWSEQRRLCLMREMHNQLFDHYKSIIPGEEQLLSKIRTFWEYAEDEIGRKNWKKLMKCGNLKNYIKNLP